MATMWRTRAMLEEAVPLELGSADRLTSLGGCAAIPARAMVEQNGGRRLEIVAPGATARSTEVRWDDSTELLVIGVWAGNAPGELPVHGPFPLPEMEWLRAFICPALPEHAPVCESATGSSSSAFLEALSRATFRSLVALRQPAPTRAPMKTLAWHSNLR